jgi:hypothetical protein
MAGRGVREGRRSSFSHPEFFKTIMALKMHKEEAWSLSRLRRSPVFPVAPLTHDEHKAAEAAFRGLPLDAIWSRKAQQVYLGIVAVTNGRDIVTDTAKDTDLETALVAVGA